MTYIEFFDKNLAENICACLANPPERVIVIGDKQKNLAEHAARFEAVFRMRGHDVAFIPKPLDRNNMRGIIEALSEIVERYSDCVFDLTGGDDLFLVAAGIVSERYKDKQIQMQRFDFDNDSVVDCDLDGKTIMTHEPPSLTVEENIRIYGGEVVYDDVKGEATHKWDMNDEFRQDIEKIWSICREDVRRWNMQISVFEVAEKLRDKSSNALTTVTQIRRLTEYLERIRVNFITDRKIIRGLCDAGLLKSYSRDGRTIRLVYKNDAVKRCLTKAGQALEMKAYLTALEVIDGKGCAVYNDVLTGVSIDWDGEIHSKANDPDTENEIDVLMMHRMVPVFVSCKNGYVEIDELYKLGTVAQRFGGKYAKKVLIANGMDEKNGFYKHLKSRAADMGIRLIVNMQSMSEEEIKSAFASLWQS